jgi:hypothetical protein
MLSWFKNAMGGASSVQAQAAVAEVEPQQHEKDGDASLAYWEALVTATTPDNRSSTAARILGQLLADRERLALGLPVSACALACPLRGTKRDRDAHHLADAITRKHANYEEPDDVRHDLEVGLEHAHWTVNALIDQLLPGSGDEEKDAAREAAYVKLANSQKVGGETLVRMLRARSFPPFGGKTRAALVRACKLTCAMVCDFPLPPPLHSGARVHCLCQGAALAATRSLAYPGAGAARTQAHAQADHVRACRR